MKFRLRFRVFAGNGKAALNVVAVKAAVAEGEVAAAGIMIRMPLQTRFAETEYVKLTKPKRLVGLTVQKVVKLVADSSNCSSPENLRYACVSCVVIVLYCGIGLFCLLGVFCSRKNFALSVAHANADVTITSRAPLACAEEKQMSQSPKKGGKVAVRSVVDSTNTTTTTPLDYSFKDLCHIAGTPH